MRKASLVAVAALAISALFPGPVCAGPLAHVTMDTGRTSEVRADYIVTSFSSDTATAFGSAEIIEDSSTLAQGTLLNVDLAAETATPGGGSPILICLNVTCLLPSGSSVTCSDCEPPYQTVEYATAYTCEESGGCEATTGNIVVMLPEGGGITVQKNAQGVIMQTCVDSESADDVGCEFD